MIAFRLECKLTSMSTSFHFISCWVLCASTPKWLSSHNVHHNGYAFCVCSVTCRLQTVKADGMLSQMRVLCLLSIINDTYKWTALLWCFSILPDKALYNSPLIHLFTKDNINCQIHRLYTLCLSCPVTSIYVNM